MTKNIFKLIPDYRIDIQVSILADIRDYNFELMNIPKIWKITKGKGIKIAILDTGLPKHVDLIPAGGHSVIPNYLQDLNGHATHVGGIIAAIANNNIGVSGIAPDADDYYVAVMDANGNGSVEQLIDGIYYAVDVLGAHIINMSLGIPAWAPHFKSLEAACNYAYNQGVAIFAAVGNDFGAVGQPAIYDSVISVAAVNNKKEHADFSNRGNAVDFAAGGVNVYSTYLNNSYAKLSGTSMACPAVAAAGALILSEHLLRNKKLTPAELKSHLQKIAFDVGPEGWDDRFGFGIPFFQ